MKTKELKEWKLALARLQDSAMLLDELIWRVIVKISPEKRNDAPKHCAYAIEDELGAHKLTKAELLLDLAHVHAVATGLTNLREVVE